MENKEKVKNNYNKIIENLERRLDKVKNNKNLYRKLKNILAIVSLIVLSFGLWPVAIIGLVSTIIFYYNEVKKGKEYNKLIEKVEDCYASIQIMEDKEKERSREATVEEEKDSTLGQEQERDYPILDVLYGDSDDNKVYRR